MRVAAILTDLDGTLLEPDGSLRDEARRAVAALGRMGVPICPVTSKTPAELGVILADLGTRSPAGFENGAGVRLADGALELLPAAVPVPVLRQIAAELQRASGVPLRTIDELDDRELGELTGLRGQALQRARQRSATMPLVVAPGHDAALEAALPDEPRVRLVRGNRFLHLQGVHDKADVVARILEILAVAGATVACGDAPNDIGLLATATVRVIVPGRAGPHPALLARFADAVVAPAPHGRGWARALLALAGEA